ncbi:MAG: hypothetical protein M3Q56_03725 [Bacteroidota bacterium]|nr:hypothetical protein [Bacteroidota bacterium]
MNFITYAFMCLFIGVYLSCTLTNTPYPEFLSTIRFWVSWAFLIWSGYVAGKVILDCLVLSSKNQMSTSNVANGILLAVLNILPTVLISVFMLKEGFK